MAIRVTQSSMPELAEYIEEIKPIFESRLLTNMGPVYKKLQHQLIDYLGVKELSMFVNGHMALEMVLQAMQLTGEVITTPYTFASTTHAIVRNNLTPVFCDIRPDDYTIDTNKIETLITEKTSAIVPVHVYGNLCDVEAIEEIARRHKLKVIYDAAHAFGVTYKGNGVGNFGDASMFSFHATKVFNTIEGGAIAFRDKSLCDKLHYLKNFGIYGEDKVADVGGNAKMDEFRAAMGICNLRHLEEEIGKRKRVFERYQENLGKEEGLRLMKIQKEVKPNYSYFPVYVDENKFGVGREEIYAKLKEEEIFARRYFYPATNEFACYRERFRINETPVAQDASLHVLTLPMYAGLALDDVDKICNVILSMKN